jgi:outer membrane protein assembly factor BamD (BamD/ComL family)
MGRKRSRAGKQVYFCIASLIFIVLAGCTIVKEMQEQDEARVTLLRGQKLLASGDYEGSLKENQKILALSGNRPPGDEALFNIGLIYAHIENPKRDYRRALGYFRKLIQEHPQSPLVEQAKIWAGVLETNDKLSQANEKLNEVVKKSKQVDIEIEEKKRAKER